MREEVVSGKLDDEPGDKPDAPKEEQDGCTNHPCSPTDQIFFHVTIHFFRLESGICHYRQEARCECSDDARKGWRIQIEFAKQKSREESRLVS